MKVDMRKAAPGIPQLVVHNKGTNRIVEYKFLRDSTIKLRVEPTLDTSFSRVWAKWAKDAERFLVGLLWQTL
uniref:Uncharacterized protein n=1 Tax=Romanomermis culicivorax TaxID=13658 RepID=A0A915KJ99_ROMCU